MHVREKQGWWFLGIIAALILSRVAGWRMLIAGHVDWVLVALLVLALVVAIYTRRCQERREAEEAAACRANAREAFLNGTGQCAHDDRHGAPRRTMWLFKPFGWFCPRHYLGNATPDALGTDLEAWGRLDLVDDPSASPLPST